MDLFNICCLMIFKVVRLHLPTLRTFFLRYIFLYRNQLLLAAIAIKNKIKVITISGGSLGSQVEEERS